MDERMPCFDLRAYARLLQDLRTAGYEFALVTSLGEASESRRVFLRHDIDLDPPSALAMAEVETELGIRATYYVPLTQPFNVLEPLHRSAVTRLRDLGHEIGLHYDMRTYPRDGDAARAHLDWELGVLGSVVGERVRTLCMHQPHLGDEDPFRSLADLAHPHDPRLGSDMLYVSDSCRAWRDASLLRAFGPDAPRRLQLNLHPELWLDGARSAPSEYLEEVLAPLLASRAEGFSSVVAAAWRGHATARQAA